MSHELSQVQAEHPPIELDMAVVFRQAANARTMLERVWDDTTAHHSVVPVGANQPVSRGQCGVSSVWLARYLSGQGYQAFVAEGVATFGRQQDEGYVWVELEDPDPNRPMVVDIASDQFMTLFGTSVHVGFNGDDLPVTYTKEQTFSPFDVPRRKLMARYAILEGRVNNLWPWQRRGLTKPLPKM